MGLYMKIFGCPLEVTRSMSLSNAMPGDAEKLKPVLQSLSVIPWGLASPYFPGGSDIATETF